MAGLGVLDLGEQVTMPEIVGVGGIAGQNAQGVDKSLDSRRDGRQNG